MTKFVFLHTITSDKSHYENVPFEIPENWCWTTLGEVGKWQSGATPSRLCKEYYGGDIPWLKTGDLNDGYITDIPEYITQKALKETSVKLNPAGSVLIAMYGATIGKVGILTFPATTNQACCACVEYEATDQQYLFYFLLSHKENFIRQGGGGAQPNISKEKIVETLLPLPPFNEQKRIVNEVEKWFSIIDKIESGTIELESYVKQTKSKILDLAISGKLVPQDPDDEPAIELLKRINPAFEPCDNSHYENLPQGWVKAGFKDVYQTISSRDYQIQQRDIINEGLYPVVSQSSNYIEGYYNNKEKLLDVTTPVLIFGDHTRVVKYIDFPFIIGADGVKVIKPLINEKFAYYLLLYTSLHIDNKGYSRHFQFIAKANYCIPPLREQTYIVKSLEILFETINTITAEL